MMVLFLVISEPENMIFAPNVVCCYSPKSDW